MMIGRDVNHCRIIRESVSGERAVDEQTFASLSILLERLETVKKLGGGFCEIGFSPAVKQLARQKRAIEVG